MLDNIKNKSGIYEIYNTNNKKRYIGQSCNVRTRLLSHRRLLIKKIHANIHLQNSFTHYGINCFEFKVIEYCNIEELDEKEKLYILKYKSNDKNFGYNIRVDTLTNRGLKWSDTQREKMAIAIKNNPWYHNHSVPIETAMKAWEASRNRIWTEEERKNHSKILKGKTVKDTSKMKIAQTGSKNNSSKLLESEVMEIIMLCDSKLFIHKIIAETYNIGLGSVNSISARRTWKHINKDNIDKEYFKTGVKKVNEYIKKRVSLLERELG